MGEPVVVKAVPATMHIGAGFQRPEGGITFPVAMEKPKEGDGGVHEEGDRG